MLVSGMPVLVTVVGIVSVSVLLWLHMLKLAVRPEPVSAGEIPTCVVSNSFSLCWKRINTILFLNYIILFHCKTKHLHSHREIHKVGFAQKNKNKKKHIMHCLNL